MEHKNKKIRLAIIILIVLLVISASALTATLLYNHFAPIEPTTVDVPGNIITPEGEDSTDSSTDISDASSTDPSDPSQTPSTDEPSESADPTPAESSAPESSAPASSPAETTEASSVSVTKASAISLHTKQPEENKRFQVTNMFPGDVETKYYRIKVSYIDRWFTEYAEPTLRPDTVSGYRSDARKICNILGDKQIRHITMPDVQKMYNKLKHSGREKIHPIYHRELADSSIRSIHMLLHEIMDAAVEKKLIAVNPTNGTTIPKNNYKYKQVLNGDQLDIFLKTMEKEPLWYDFFYTELTTGLRRGEICALRWEDFDEKTGTLRVQRSLNGKMRIGETKTETGKRVILLPDSTYEILQDRKNRSISEWIFPSLICPEKPTSPSAAYHKMKDLLKDAGLPNIRFHDLRHTFATHAIKNGVDAKTLSGILGHTNASFTLDTYTHITTDMQKNASGIVGDFMEDLFGKELKPWEQEEKTDLVL